MTQELGLPLVDEDIMSREMGQPGVDIRCSPLAQDSLRLLVECKNTERFNAIGEFNEHWRKYATEAGLKIVVHTRNGRGNIAQPRLVLLRLEDFISLLKDRINLGQIEAGIKAGNFDRGPAANL